MTEGTPEHTGGCLCGAVRYRAAGEPVAVTLCHCSMCRRASGGPFLTFARFAAKDFTFTRGQPALFRSSESAVRGFCRRCGCQLTFQFDHLRDYISVSLGSLDRPEALPPTQHIWTESQIGWLDLDDGLPRRPGPGDLAPTAKAWPGSGAPGRGIS